MVASSSNSRLHRHSWQSIRPYHPTTLDSGIFSGDHFTGGHHRCGTGARRRRRDGTSAKGRSVGSHYCRCGTTPEPGTRPPLGHGSLVKRPPGRRFGVADRNRGGCGREVRRSRDGADRRRHGRVRARAADGSPEDRRSRPEPRHAGRGTPRGPETRRLLWGADSGATADADQARHRSREQ